MSNLEESKKVIDLAKWNGVTDYNKVKGAGVDGAIVNVINAQKSPDGRLDIHVNGLSKAGVPVIGGYNYLDANTIAKAKQTAPIFMKMCVDRGIKQAWADIEDVCMKNLGSRMADIIKIYKEQAEKYNLYFGVYTGQYFYNTYISKDILHKGASPLPTLGEKVICRKNNWEIETDGINLTNGLSGTVMNMPSIREYHSGSLFTIDFAPDLFPDVVFRDIDCDFKYFTANTKMRYSMKEFGNPNYRPDGEKFEFSYAITTHLSQGSQFYSGIYLQEYFGGGPEMRKHLNYTGITRFRSKCVYVTPPIGVYIPIKKAVVSFNGKMVLE